MIRKLTVCTRSSMTAGACVTTEMVCQNLMTATRRAPNVMSKTILQRHSNTSKMEAKAQGASVWHWRQLKVVLPINANNCVDLHIVKPYGNRDKDQDGSSGGSKQDGFLATLC